MHIYKDLIHQSKLGMPTSFEDVDFLLSLSKTKAIVTSRTEEQKLVDPRLETTYFEREVALKIILK